MSERLHHQTTRLSKGRHDGPGDEVCVMELASMLAGERFTDRPASVCPVLAALLRAYNDSLNDSRRQSLRQYASDCVGTRADYALERRRAAVALAHACGGNAARRSGWRRLPRERSCPPADATPKSIADYVIKSIGKSHLRMLALLEELIAMGRRGVPPELTDGASVTTTAEMCARSRSIHTSNSLSSIYLVSSYK